MVHGVQNSKIASNFLLGKLLRKAFVRLGYHSKPAFIIIGAQKAGTTVLFDMLTQHPKIVGPLRKELHFFDDFEIRYGDFSAYHDAFPLPHQLLFGKITFEGTPSYLYDRECAQRIYDYSPNMKLIAILRDPVRRAYSAWNMYRKFATSPDPLLRKNAELRTFEEAVLADLKVIDRTEWSNNLIAYVKRGIYVEQLQRCFQKFPRESCLVLDQWELLHNTEKCLAETCQFLNIDDKFQFRVERRASTYENVIPQRTADILRSFYAPYNRDLFKLLGKEFNW